MSMTFEELKRYERDCGREDLSTLAIHHEWLVKAHKIATRRVKIAATKDYKDIIEELNLRLQAVRISYKDIDVTAHTSVVVARLAELQGKEREITEQQGIWLNAKDSKKDLDSKLQICERVIVEKSK